MKRKLLIFSSLITLLLSVFSVPIFAETTTHDDAGSTPIYSDIQLDSYFYNNYDLLPYIESTSNQYIDTGVTGRSDLKVVAYISGLVTDSDHYLFGSRIGTGNTEYGVRFYTNDELYSFQFNSYFYRYNYDFNYYDYFSVGLDQNNAIFNDNIVGTMQESTFDNLKNIYVFTCNNNGSPLAPALCRLHKFYIYDYSANDGEGAYLRYYYPAKAKASGIIGLYDSINKTFVTTSGSTPFSSPTNDYVMNFQIGTFISSSLGWIGQIFTAIIQIPIIIVFMAIGLAGAMFRWGRRIVHF